MSSFQRVLFAALTLVLAPVSCISAHAGVIALGNDNYNRVYGIDDAGHAVMQDLFCDAQGDTCYKTYTFTSAGSMSEETTWTAPALTLNPTSHESFGNPPACVPFAAGWSSLGAGACNNGEYAFGAEYTYPNGSSTAGIFTGFDPVADFVASGVPVAISLDLSGDFLFDDGLHDESYLYINPNAAAVTPEPNTLLLTSSASLLFAAAFALRRRTVVTAADGSRL